MSDSDILNNSELKKILKLLITEQKSNTIDSYFNIKEILSSIEFPIPYFVYPKGQRFVRTRVHSDGEYFFEDVHELSYRKDIQNITKFGRANEPNQSMFYCSNDDTLSFVETSNITRKLENKSFEYSTNSLWIAQEDLLIVSFLSNDDIKGKNSELDFISKSFESLLLIQNDEYSISVRELLNFISKQFSSIAENDSKHYKITCAITNYIFNNIVDVDGILYPSSIHNEKGFNFVFKPSTVDSKLKFHLASRRKMVFDGKKSYFETELIDSKIHQSKDSKIIW